jgi:hypothetical protein
MSFDIMQKVRQRNKVMKVEKSSEFDFGLGTALAEPLLDVVVGFLLARLDPVADDLANGVEVVEVVLVDFVVSSPPEVLGVFNGVQRQKLQIVREIFGGFEAVGVDVGLWWQESRHFGT